MGWGLAVSIGLTLGGMAWNKWFRDKTKPSPIREYQIPRTDETAPYPLVYGKCRVRSPILAWVGTPTKLEVDPEGPDYFGFPGPYAYGLDMFFVIGLGFTEQTGNKLHSIYASDLKIPHNLRSSFEGTFVALEDLLGTGSFERDTRVAEIVRMPRGEDIWFEGEIEWHSGLPTQQIVDDTNTATTLAGERMLGFGVAGPEIPGYRGMMCALLARNPADKYDTLGGEPGFDNFVDGFLVGPTPSVPAIQFEVSSYDNTPVGSPAVGSVVDAGMGAVESNPADVLIDLLTGDFGRLGLSSVAIDAPSFKAAAITLSIEGNGYSRAIDDTVNASDAISEILEQIDGVLFEDNATGKLVLKLVRADYDPNGVLTIDENNGELAAFTRGSWTGCTNRVRVVFNDRGLDYRDNSATAHNHAVAAVQGTNEAVFTFRGCCTRQLAEKLAERELRYLSRPLMQAKLLVNRSFVDAMPGSVVALNWAELGISRRLFRVASVEGGTLEDAKIGLNLIEDIFFQQGSALVDVPIPPFPTESEA